MSMSGIIKSCVVSEDKSWHVYMPLENKEEKM